MFAVHFYHNKNLLLTQLLRHVPSEGDNLTIKGRKGKVASVTTVDEKHIHVQLVIEEVKKSKFVIDNSKKKKR